MYLFIFMKTRWDGFLTVEEGKRSVSKPVSSKSRYVSDRVELSDRVRSGHQLQIRLKLLSLCSYRCQCFSAGCSDILQCSPSGWQTPLDQGSASYGIISPLNVFVRKRCRRTLETI